MHPPNHFLGCNITPESDSRTQLTMKAYVMQLASKYLPQPLADYPRYTTPSTKELFKSYETALKREHTPSPALASSYASKVGAMIFAAPAARFECAYSIGICARCLTFPTEEMDAHADRIICYMAQHAENGVVYDADAPEAWSPRLRLHTGAATRHVHAGGFGAVS